jgi:hypothetical protein
MRNEHAEMDKQQSVELIPDFSYEDRHEFVTNLAYRLWKERGSPQGSPEVDWIAAEQALYSSLVASGLINPSATDLRNLEEKLYR